MALIWRALHKNTYFYGLLKAFSRPHSKPHRVLALASPKKEPLAHFRPGNPEFFLKERYFRFFFLPDQGRRRSIWKCSKIPFLSLLSRDFLARGKQNKKISLSKQVAVAINKGCGVLCNFLPALCVLLAERNGKCLSSVNCVVALNGEKQPL